MSHTPTIHCRLLFLLLTLVLFVSSVHAAAAVVSSDLCNADDEAALLAIKASLGDPSQAFASWKPDTPCCEWSGVSCLNGRVYSLGIGYDDEIAGTIPEEISGLSSLSGLYFRHLPGLTGTIPSSICQITGLYTLEISSCRSISGSIPSCLSKIDRLNSIYLSNNNLSGSIPPSLFTGDLLYTVDLSNNQLTGTIPESFGPNLFSLYLDHNRLSGRIPDTINQVSRLDYFDVSYNLLCGEIPQGANSAKFGKSAYENNPCVPLCGSPLHPCNYYGSSSSVRSE